MIDDGIPIPETLLKGFVPRASCSMLCALCFVLCALYLRSCDELNQWERALL